MCFLLRDQHQAQGGRGGSKATAGEALHSSVWQTTTDESFIQEQFPSKLRPLLTSHWDKTQVWPETSPSGVASLPSTSVPLQSKRGIGKKNEKGAKKTSVSEAQLDPTSCYTMLSVQPDKAHP